MYIERKILSREKKQPKLGSIEHAEWQSKMNDVNGLADIILGKQRHGPTGTVKVEFEEFTQNLKIYPIISFISFSFLVLIKLRYI